MRIGHGTDIHAFDDSLDRPLRLGGVVIPDGTPLAGHSDADVVLHALTDALLGAAAAGDLGELVGVDEPDTRDVDSAVFLRQAMAVLEGVGLSVGNVDVTVIAQRPRLAQHRQSMRERVATLLSVDASRVSVKATTTDRLGFIGRGEGVACTAVVLLEEA